MAKANVTRKARPRRQQEDLTVRPSRLRMFVVYVVAFALAMLLGLIFRLLANGWAITVEFASQTWPTWLAIIFGGAALMAVIERGRWTLRMLGGDRLEGPTGMFGERIVIPIKDIDWERSRRSLLSPVKMGNAIYGKERARILISQWFFDPAILRELFDQLGFEA